MNHLKVKSTKTMGRGVFTNKNIRKGNITTVCTD